EVGHLGPEAANPAGRRVRQGGTPAISPPQCPQSRRSTRGRSMDATALEHVVDGAADAVPRARRFAAEALAAEVEPSVVEDAELVVTELVTNALLHGAPPVMLRISSAGSGVRIEVEDTGRGM